METPRVLVLLAAYQGRRFIDQQIASILWQVGVEPRIVIRDDGSTDDTLAACEAWAARYPGSVSILRDGVHTRSAGANFLRLLTRVPLDDCDYVALADQDDVWFPDKLARAIEAMTASGAGGYSSDLLAVDEAARTAWILEKSGRDAPLDYLFQGASAGCTYVLSAVAARTVSAVLTSIAGEWLHGLSHDWTIYAVCRSNNLGWVRDPRPGLLYRQHGGNDYGARQGWGGWRRRLRSIRDSWYRTHVSWLRHAVAMTPAEREVFAALDRGDRRWLARNARRFRRTKRDAYLLALSFLTGLF